jgi:hypothetical protein
MTGFGLLAGCVAIVAAIAAATPAAIAPAPLEAAVLAPQIPGPVLCEGGGMCPFLNVYKRRDTINKYRSDPIVNQGSLLITGYTSLVEPHVTVVYECSDNAYPTDRTASDIYHL